MIVGNTHGIMHAEQTILKSQLHIKLHYTWGDDTGEKKNVTILDHIHIEENNVELVLAKKNSMKQKLQY